MNFFIFTWIVRLVLPRLLFGVHFFLLNWCSDVPGQTSLSVYTLPATVRLHLAAYWNQFFSAQFAPFSCTTNLAIPASAARIVPKVYYLLQIKRWTAPCVFTVFGRNYCETKKFFNRNFVLSIKLMLDPLSRCTVGQLSSSWQYSEVHLSGVRRTKWQMRHASSEVWFMNSSNVRENCRKLLINFATKKKVQEIMPGSHIVSR